MLWRSFITGSSNSPRPKGTKTLPSFEIGCLRSCARLHDPSDWNPCAVVQRWWLLGDGPKEDGKSSACATAALRLPGCARLGTIRSR